MEAAQHGALRKKGQFVVAEPTEDGDARQGRADAVPGIGHAGIVLGRSRWRLQDRRRAESQAAEHALDGRDEVEGEATFVDASVGSRLESARQKHSRIVLAHDYNLCRRDFIAKQFGDVESAHAGHTDIQKNAVGRGHCRDLKGLGAILGFAAHFPLGHRCEDISHTATDAFIVIGDQDPHRRWLNPLDRQRGYHASV